MARYIRLISKNLYLFLLVLIIGILGVVNHEPGTWLSGWDALNPEFNFPLSFERAVFGVFRPEQGLGAVAAQSHMADLPRLFLLYLASFVVPLSLVRYLFIVLYLLIGVTGVYFFIERILLKGHTLRSGVAFAGSLFYLFNLGTLQHFVVILEMFAVAYAFIPWLFLAATLFLEAGKPKQLLLFAFLSLLAAPMAHTATLWYSFFLIFILFLLHFIKYPKRVLILLLTVIAVNSFWLLPNLYFLKNSAPFIEEAKVNKIFSEEAFLHNKNYGNAKDLVIFRNFLFDWMVYKGGTDARFEYLLGAYNKFLEASWVAAIGYAAGFIALLGIVLAVIKRNSYAKALIVPCFAVVVFIFNNNPPLGFAFDYFQKIVPLFKESMRFPFTKFSIPLMFFFACFFAFGLLLISNAGGKVFKRAIFSKILTLAIAVLLIIYGAPFFRGELISKYLQVKIPPEYFRMFDWFNSQPDGRILQLPLHSFWNWSYYSWGFQGAYFVPFGIRQPVMDRDFDRWNLANEQAFREFSYALYSKDRELFKKTLNKYQISYIMLDKNIIAPDQDKKMLFYDEIKSLFNESEQVRPAAEFGNITVYKAGDFAALRSAATFASIETSGTETDFDPVYNNLGDYIATSQMQSLIYPFYSLSDNQNFLKNQNLDNNLLDGASLLSGSYIKAEKYLPLGVFARQTGSRLEVRLVSDLLGEKLWEFGYDSPAKNWLLYFDLGQVFALKNLSPEYSEYGKVFFSKDSVNNFSLYSGAQTDFRQHDFTVSEPQICSDLRQNQEVSLKAAGNNLLIAAKNASSCVRIPLKLLPGSGVKPPWDLYQVSFTVDASSENAKGHYCFYDNTLKRCAREIKNIENGQITDYVTVAPEDSGRWDLLLFADNFSNTEAAVAYKKISIVSLKPEAFWSVTTRNIEQKLGDRNFQLGGKSFLNTLEGFSREEVDILANKSSFSTCRNSVPENFSRAVNVQEGYVEYRTLNGSSCDFFALPNLPHNLGYLVSFESMNLSGLGLRICVLNNLSKRCDIFSALPLNNGFKKDVIVVPPISDAGAGYELHFDNYSIGSTPTVNRIKNLNITPFPYYWLTGMAFGGSKGDVISRPEMQIKYYRKLFPFLYTMRVENAKDEPGLLVLNESYDSGWKASSGRHVRVNNWANGWLIDESGEKTIYIFFWPQMLEFAGFIIAGVSFVLLLRRIRF